MELCIFSIIKGGYTIKNNVLNTYIIKSIQLAFIQAFTAPGEMKFEEMVVYLKFHQKMNNNDKSYHVCIKSIIKS
jgi:hypothetical protein